MDFNLEEMLNRVLDQLNSVAKTETVMGESFKLGEFTCVPVVKIGIGFGSGGGGSDVSSKKITKHGGAGAGLGIEPIGFLVTRNDEISMISVSRSKGIQSVFEKVPDLIEKLMNLKKEKEDKKDE